jgi:glucose/arabinose dehydrogenase
MEPITMMTFTTHNPTGALLRATVFVALLAAMLVLTGCGKAGQAEASPGVGMNVAGPAGAEAPSEAPDEEAPAAAAALVEVSASGTNFDPPVQKAQIPEGAWYCDMGTVHFARTEEGDKTCPRCKMKLHHKGHEGH